MRHPRGRRRARSGPPPAAPRAGAILLIGLLLGGLALGGLVLTGRVPVGRGESADPPPAPPAATTAPGGPAATLSGAPPTDGPPTGAPPTGRPGATVPGARDTPPAGGRDSTPTGRRSAGWTVTVYYTAVERFHDGPPTTVTGCLGLDCTHGRERLGRYPAGFVAAVRAEGTGQTAGGRYLNWSHDVGFWLDEAPRDAAGGVLRPWQSAAADPDVLAAGTAFRIADCGHDGSGEPVDPSVCARLREARWTITDEFTPGLGGLRHVDVYIGAQTGPDFESSPWYTALAGATLRIG